MPFYVPLYTPIYANPYARPHATNVEVSGTIEERPLSVSGSGEADFTRGNMSHGIGAR